MKQCGSEYFTWPLTVTQHCSVRYKMGLCAPQTEPDTLDTSGMLKVVPKITPVGYVWELSGKGQPKVVVCLHMAQTLCRGLAESDLSLGNLGPICSRSAGCLGSSQSYAWAIQKYGQQEMSLEAWDLKKKPTKPEPLENLKKKNPEVIPKLLT